MRRHIMTASAVLTLLTVVIYAQVTDPLPNVEKRGLTVQIQDLVRLPQTRGLRPIDQDVNPSGWARVSYVRDLPTDAASPTTHAASCISSIATTSRRCTSTSRRRSRWRSTTGSKAGSSASPSIPPGYAVADVTHRNIITEWRTTNPSANTFEGTRRELLRTAHVVQNLTHPMGAVEFNPTAKPGSPDYGLLYTSGSDHGFCRRRADRGILLGSLGGAIMIDRLFEKIGGRNTIKELVRRFYDRVLADPRLAPFFPNSDMDALRAKQVMFISMLLGSAQAYKGRDLTTTHAGARAQGLTDEHFDALLGHFEAALQGMKVEEDYTRELMARLETTRNAVLGR